MNVNSCELTTLNMLVYPLNRVQFDLQISQVKLFKIVTSAFKHNKKKAITIERYVRYLLID